MKKIVFVFLVIISIVLINSCEKKQGGLPSQLSNCDTTNLTDSSGAAVMQGIINANCATGGCHVPHGSAPTIYTTYSSMQPYVTGGESSTFWTYLFVNKTMPLSPQPPLDACTQAKFKAWLRAGAPR